MPTTVVKTIGPSGKDYTSIQAWEDAAPANLVTADQVWEGQCALNAFSSGSLIATISGSTTDATRFKRLKCEAGASFRDHASKQTNALAWNNTTGASIAAGDNYSSGFLVTENFAQIDGLMFKSSSTANARPTLDIQSSNNKVTNCIIQGDLPLVLSNGGSMLVVEQCLIIKATSGGAAVVIQIGAELYGCTIVKPSDIGTSSVGVACQYLSSSVVLKNCAVFGFTNVFTLSSSGGNTVNCTTCATDVASPPSGCTTFTYNTSLFVNITNATKDYRLPSGSNLIGAGTNDSTHSAFDILNVARPQSTTTDIGAHEFIASSVPSITDFGDESHRVGEVGVVITGTGFGATQGTGFVKIAATDSIVDANAVSQTVTSWSDTSITINIVRGSSVPLPLFTNVYLFVKNDAASSNASGYVHQLTAPVAALLFATDILN